jgi:hypothetical protein
MAMAGFACRLGPPTTVSLAQLVSREGEYAGRRVEVSGTVRAFDDRGRTYYVVEDAEAHRVALRPSDVVAPYLSKRVRATGTFDLDPAAGRFIRVTRIVPISTGGEGP